MKIVLDIVMKEIYNTRIKEMEKKSTPPKVRYRREQLRSQRQSFGNIAEQNEGVVYGAGLF